MTRYRCTFAGGRLAFALTLALLLAWLLCGLALT